MVVATEWDPATVETTNQPTDLATEAEATEWEAVAMEEATNVVH